MTDKILITSALPYANGPLHFGHIAGAYLPGDCYARFQRLMQNDVLYICGSDEYGVAITMSADIAKRSPKEHVDIFHQLHRELFKKLNFSFDHFSRTTSPGHQELAQEFFLELLANGYIEEKITDQLYSEEDKKFLADRYVTGECPRCGFVKARGDECPECGASYEATDLKNPRSKLSNAPLILKQTKHWFLLLDKFRTPLIEWLETRNWKPNVSNFIKGYIQDLHPRAITRDSAWGIPVPLPNTEGKVLYVWFDAPIGYISATMEWARLIGKPDAWKAYWQDPKTKLVNFIGKDNIPFHAAIFPAMIMGQNQPYKVVDELPANEFYKLEGRQFSKSDGWYIDLDDFFSHYTADQIRYAIAANAPETSDSEFTWHDFQSRCNSDLLGKYGNLINRVLVFAHNRCEGKVPTEKLEELDLEFLNTIQKLALQAEEQYRQFKIRAACQTIMELAQCGNVYFDHKKPWQDAKHPDRQIVMETTIACCLACIKTLAIISSPIIPDTAARVWKMLGYTSSLEQISWKDEIASRPPVGQILEKPEILFQKVEDEQIEKEIVKLQELSQKQQKAEQKSTYEPLKPSLGIEEIRQMDLRVGVILEAIPVPKSKKLLKLLVDIGFEKRTIVAGISLFYKPDEIIGKRVLVVANLKPATLMGVESHGMLLAGSMDGALELAGFAHLPPGSTVA